VYRDDQLVAFLDTKPLFHGHVLLVPTTHIRTYDQLPAALASKWLAVSQGLQRAVQSAMGSQGSLLIVNNIVSQTVPHLHLHVIPRTKGDGLRFWLGPRHPYADEAEADAVAARIASAFSAL
jgi:histidine triad (HIT) family protein